MGFTGRIRRANRRVFLRRLAEFPAKHLGAP
jgi:hypothetical protein